MKVSLMRVLSTIILLLAVFSAGCVTGDEPAADTATDEVPRVTANETSKPVTATTTVVRENATAPPADPPELTQYGCTMVFAYTTVSQEFARAHMPDGFAPAGFGGGPAFGIKTWKCASSTFGELTIESPASIVYYLLVDPPDEYENTSISVYWLPLGFVASSTVEARVYQGWNLGAPRVGEIAVDAYATPAGGLGHASADASDVDLTLVASYGAFARGTAFTARYFGTRDGVVTNVVDIAVSPHQNAGAGEAVVRLLADASPATNPFRGIGSTQHWPADEVSYTWRNVELPLRETVSAAS